MDVKRANGVFYTEQSPFILQPFKKWAQAINLPNTKILEPFAGANNIIDMLRDARLCDKFASYDISPMSREVKKHDSIFKFPRGYQTCITNPPWLARNSATRRGLPFPINQYDDLYKYCIELCLNHCDYVGALIPASFLQSGLFTDRLTTYILLHKTIFSDTENPVCLALFNKHKTNSARIYYDNNYIGNIAELARYIPEKRNSKAIKFNDPNGELGFISFDNTKAPTIRFCKADEISRYPIKHSSRFITRISGDFGNMTKMVKKLNQMILKFRYDTQDVFLTPFKGLRADGQYRRRMDFALARRFIKVY